LVMIMATVGMANPPQSDEPATLYIVRPAQVAVAIKFKVQIDGSYAGFTRGRKYIKKTLSPGTHKIQSKAENMAEYDLKVEPGKTYYIKQQVTLGVTARNELVLLDETNGKAALEKCKPSKDMGE
ncbi:MAG: DUF2846 domain-containing protein, partial [Flavobacteriales bacterium]|nr:DUF2846 domain-containing protein [Flavobacteriales bacterium]